MQWILANPSCKESKELTGVNYIIGSSSFCMETVAVAGARAQFQPGDAVLFQREQPGPPGEHTPLSLQDRN